MSVRKHDKKQKEQHQGSSTTSHSPDLHAQQNHTWFDKLRSKPNVNFVNTGSVNVPKQNVGLVNNENGIASVPKRQWSVSQLNP
jgi:hypothetical protein